ncbi:MAG: putative resolvase [Edaphobacter sp.]|nr:putative resolvase [Edaphobacter sp.]
MGGRVPLGYDLKDRKLIVNTAEAKHVQEIFHAYLEVGCVRRLKAHLEEHRIGRKVRIGSSSQMAGGGSYSRGALYKFWSNRIYIGEIFHKGNAYPGEHKPIIDRELWESVRAKLEKNHRARRLRTYTSEPSLLSGLIFDQDGVSVPIALAPLLGKVSIPPFSSLLSLIPQSIQGVVIPVSASAMVNRSRYGGGNGKRKN